MASEQPRLCHICLIRTLSILLACLSVGLRGERLRDGAEKKASEFRPEILKTRDSELIGWSEWSDWSMCSRSCDGGVTYQLRRCIDKSECKGDPVRYHICNMEGCPEQKDFRGTQCTAFNDVPYRGQLYEWLPFYDSEDTCALTCQAKENEFVAKLAQKVKDGTRCRQGSLDMCVDGKCMPVGCDLQLGSNKTIDKCGVCGGDGSTCRQPNYVWKEIHMSPCSVTCGGGFLMSRAVCKNDITGKEVTEMLCDPTVKPRPQVQKCNIEHCPAEWIAESWESCSTSCGGGIQTRSVFCAQGGSNGTSMRISDTSCSQKKPINQRSCNTQSCTRWTVKPWSGCSVTCGQGMQTRNVICYDHKGSISGECDYRTRPETKRTCTSEITCPLNEKSVPNINPQEDAPPEHFGALPWTQQSFDPSEVSKDPWFVVSDWQSCSVTCGEGIRRRFVECKIFLEFSRSVANLPDRECPGRRPSDVEKCFSRPCALDQNKDEADNSIDEEKNKADRFFDGKHGIPLDATVQSRLGGKVGIEVTYSWRKAGFTPCSASCLGGIQESIIQCIRDHDQATVSSLLCDINKKPRAITQTCNDHACPPRWNVSDFSACSKPCGGGLQNRGVQCIHEVTRGAANTLVVASSLCPQPPPRVQQICNVNDCPSRWRAEPYNKCSKRCGGGLKTRKIKCEKELAFGRIVSQPPSMCPKKRPRTEKYCNIRKCNIDTGKVPYIKTSDQNYVQKNPIKKLKLKVGGHAVLFENTIIKIRCPARNFNKSLIIWYKDKHKIEESKKFKISRRGALRIRHLTPEDNGKYSCVAAPAKANIMLVVKPLPPGYDEEKMVEKLNNKSHCSNAACSVENTQISSIESNKFIQQFPKQKVYLKTGGYASLFHGTKLKLRCAYPSKNSFPVEWYKDKNKIQLSHKYSITSSGKLKVRHLVKEDSGRYTCIVGPIKSDIFISVKHSSPKYGLSREAEDRYISKMKEDSYSHENSDHASAGKAHPNHANFANRPNVQKPGMKSFFGQDSQERSKNRQQGKFRTKSQKYPSYSSSTEDKHYPKIFDTWEYQNGGALFSDQESDGINPGSPPGGYGILDVPQDENEDQLHSGAASTYSLPHLRQLLINLRETLGGSSILESIDDSREESSTQEKDSPVGPLANSIFLGNGNPENLKFDWDVTEWSLCSHSCGGNGYQCSENTCFERNTAYQERKLHCRLLNGTEVDVHHCKDKTRPRRRRECYNDQCKGVWKVGEWSECTVTCGDDGFRTRILQCVWFGTKEAAGDACREQPRPSVIQKCTRPPCTLDECPRKRRRVRSEPRDIEDRLESLITRVGEKSTSSLESNLEGLAGVLEADLPSYRSKILRILSDCVTRMPEKTTIYTTLVGLLNARNYNFGGEFVELLVKNFKEYLKNCQFDEARSTLRFLADLVNCNVISIGSLMNLIESMVEVTQEDSIPQVRSDWFVYAVLSCLPWVGRELYEKKDIELDGLMRKIETYVSKRQKVHHSALRVWQSDIPHPQEEYLDCLWAQIVKLQGDKWIERHIIRPYLAFDGVLCEALQHNIPQLTIPPHHDECTYPFPFVVFRFFDYTDCPEGPILPGAHSIERFLIEEHLHRIIDQNYEDRKACAGALLSFPGKHKLPIEYMITEVIFSQLFTLPVPKYLEIFHGSLILELCRVQPSTMPQALAQAVEMLYDRLDTMNVDCIDRFASWFAYHLNNFQFRWSWDDWKPAANLDPLHPKTKFMQNALQKCLRLSYQQRLVELLPEELSHVIPKLPTPYYKYSSEGAGSLPGTMVAHQLASAIKEKCTPEEALLLIKDLPNPLHDDDVEPTHNPLKIEVFVQTLLNLASKSFSHCFAAIAKFHYVFRMLASSEEAQICILRSMFELWKNHQQMMCVFIDKLLKTQILECSAVANWVFSKEMAPEFTKGYVWEILHLTIKKMIRHVEKMQTELSEARVRLQKAEEDDEDSGDDSDKDIPTEEMIERKEERYDTAQSDLKNLFLIIFQRFIMILTEHIAQCEAEGKNFKNFWFKWTTGRLLSVFFQHHEQVFKYIGTLESLLFTSDIDQNILSIFQQFCALKS
ncbi:uncharacterized protein LOC106472631 isoform X3 [Limulus polyphemus]|uniref:Nuclear cap-binding protein subunit 1 n=1 Tax=Limulus polyphemus TaxID=6850 RepID=A0ABM1TPA0_LIMPO|nr:uncharacterized protein LOC106472631 isoform X3 [Limulus polyphemus]